MHLARVPRGTWLSASTNQQRTGEESHGNRLARWAWLAAFAVVAVVLFIAYLRMSRTYPVTSDGADQVLQGWGMLHGNWLLHGWTIADVTYYTTEVPQYMLVEMVRGLGPDVVHIAGAMTYTLLVLAAGLLARGRATGREGIIRLLVAASILSFGMATLVVRLISNLHGYQVLPLAAQAAPIDEIPQHVVLTLEGILSVYGADFFHLSNGSLLGPGLGRLPLAVGVALAVVHLVGVALAAWGFFRAFRYFFDPGDLISPVLATAIAVNVVAYVLSVIPVGVFDTREIVAVLPFGAVLAGRMVPARLAGVPRRLKPALAWASAGVLACYLAALGYGAAQPPVADNEQAIVPWLEAHHLTTGLGTYNEANLITSDSGGRVAVRTVSWQSSGNVPRSFESNTYWFDPRHNFANFIVTNTADTTPNRDGSLRRSSMIPSPAIAALHAGPPVHVYHFKTFTIMVWDHNLLDNLGRPASTLPGEIPCYVKCV